MEPPYSLKFEDLHFSYKPAGVATHRPSYDHLGFVEWLSQKNQEEYLVCHRLDKETSGAIVFAKNKRAAKLLNELFFQRLIKKEYYFLSDKKSEKENWTVAEEKAKDTRGDGCPESKGRYESYTEFQRLCGENSLYLYKAKPLTGKTHQIRKHAVKSKIPILGDSEYGGREFPRLMLHSLELSFKIDGDNISHKEEPSLLFKNLELCEDKQLAGWVCEIERRQKLYPQLYKGEQAIRLLHSETGDLRIDQVADRWVMGWWKSEAPSKEEISKIRKLMAIFAQKKWVFHWRPGVGQKQQMEILLKSEALEEQDWTFLEGNIKYQASLDRGQNFGLFLDQRQRRQWVQAQSSHKKVLNLFAFTCGFSVNAAKGGASQVVSVDSFAKYLNWGKENFQLNQLDPESKPYEFRCMDSLEYLKYAAKKEMKFDIIICDPPSFSRNKKSKKVFRVERDFKALIAACSKVLTPTGTLLFSTNYEKWDYHRWLKELKLTGHEFDLTEVSASHSQWDYEWQKHQANLKAFFVRRLV